VLARTPREVVAGYTSGRTSGARSVAYSSRVRTDRGWRRFYGVGWLVSGAITVAAFRQWQAHVREVEERAAQIERTQEEVARRRAAEERLRIARELHDSLTHSISVVTLQAGVATHLARKRGEEVPESLLAIQKAAAEAARELRDTLAVLRRDDLPGGHGIDELDALVERASGAGVPTTLRVRGRPRPVPDEVGTAAYRIVQEALTNVARHAGPATATVTVDYAPDALSVSVRDDGRGCVGGAPTPGLGLVGMRERTGALGGTLVTHGDGSGFLVRAVMPIGGRP
jgi:signal transduction histidine kinase